jgi:hypothetical protein
MPAIRPQSREVSVIVQDFTVTGDLVYDHGTGCYTDIEDVYLQNKGVAMYVDDAAKLGALIDGQWVSFADMLRKEVR